MLGTSTTAEKLLSDSPQSPPLQSVMSIGAFAECAVNRQFHLILQHQQGVLKDQDPEHLHQMRVAFRRLRTAVEIFQGVIKLPKAASVSKIRMLSQSLGKLRDLDVQLQSLQSDYGKQSTAASQRALQRMDKHLHKQRRKVFKSVKTLLRSKVYQKFSQAYEVWLVAPVFDSLAPLPLPEILPELLLPRVAQLFIHPGWQLSAAEIELGNSKVMHDLRKRCKHVRYQSEFFTDFYGKDFKKWIKSLKKIQDQLGYLQDSYVFLEMVGTVVSHPSEQKALASVSEAHRLRALTDWDKSREPYLDLVFRRQLYQMILNLDINPQDDVSADKG